MIGALVVLAVITAPAAEHRVGILPVTGTAALAERRAAEATTVETIQALEGLSPVAFSSLGAVFGPRAQAALQACADDACRAREATSRIGVDRLVVIELDGREALRLRLRLIDPARPEVPVARVSKDTASGPLPGAVATAVVELFPEAAGRSLGQVVLSGGRSGAAVKVDGQTETEMRPSLVSSEPSATLRLRPGLHRIEVTYPGHFPFRTRVEVRIGPVARVAVELRKNRSVGPWILGGAGLALIGAAGLVGLNVQNTADEWSDACAGASCAPGFTRLRYEEDQTRVDTGRVVANSLLIGGGAAVVAALLWYLLDPGTDPAGEAAP